MKPIKTYNEFVNEAWIGPFVFNEDMTDDELKAIYQGALDGFAYWQKGFEYPKADYKKAYQEIGKILKKRGVNVNESVNEAKKPKSWDTTFAMNAIADYEAGKFDPDNDKSLADWEKEYNGGKKPNPGFETYDIIAYALTTGKKPDGTPIKESVNEGSKDEMVKKEAISRLADFFRVSPGPLMKFKFDGSDNIKDLTKVLNSTSDQGTELYYKTAIKLAQEEVGFDESVNEAEKIEVGVFVRYKKDKDFTGGKVKSINGSNAEIHNWDGSTTELPLKDLEYVKSWNESLSKLEEGAIKQFEMDYKDMENNIKRGIGWIDPEYVEETWENSSDTIDYEIVRNEILTRLIKAGLLYTSQDGETKDKKITNISQIK